MRDWEAWVRGQLGLPMMTDRRDLRSIRELAAHLEEAWTEACARGATEDEADRIAREMLGDRTTAAADLLRAERHHVAAEADRRVEAMEERLRGKGRLIVPVADMLRDMRVGLRTLARRPFFAATVVVVLALGIGATTAIFTLVDAVVISPLPFPEADRLVVLTHTASKSGGGAVGQCAAWHLTYEDENKVFESLGMYAAQNTVAVTGRGEPQTVPSMDATFGVFGTLGLPAVVGRTFSRADAEPGAPEVVLLGHSYWRATFGGDRAVVGTTLRVDGVESTIVGVLSPDVAALGPEPSVVTLLRFRRASIFVGNVGFTGVARLKPGVTREQAVADMARMLPMAFDKFPGGPVVVAMKQAAFVPSALPLKEQLVGGVTRLLWVLMACVAGVLLIACTNAANLFLVRAEGRVRELAVRAALGAGGMRMAWEHVKEAVLLAGLGGAAGLMVAWGGLRALVSSRSAQIPRLSEVSLGTRAFLFGLAVSAAATVFVSVVPLIRRRDWRTFEALKQTGPASGMSRARHRVLHGLAAAQVAIALVLLIALGLVVRSGTALRHVNPGFTHQRDVLVLRLNIPGPTRQAVFAAAQVPDPATAPQPPAPAELARIRAAVGAVVNRNSEMAALAQENIARRLAEIPGVTSVAMATDLPMHAGANINPLFVEGVTEPGRTPPLTRRHRWIGEGYFETLGIPVLAGRTFTWQDIHNRIPAAIVSEGLARAYWGSPAAAIGKRVAARPDPVRWNEVIGVVGDVRESGAHLDPIPMVYWPQVTLAFFQGSPADNILLWRNASYAVRSTRVGTAGFLREVHQAVWTVNKDLPLEAVGPLDGFVAQSWANTSFMLALLGVAACVALVLGLVGVYGVLSYTVSQRTVELATRMVLGADGGEVARLVLTRAVAVVGAGTAIGLAIALIATRAMSNLLYGVGARDAVTFATVTLVLAGVALAASYAPARRAARVSPAAVMRAE